MSHRESGISVYLFNSVLVDFARRHHGKWIQFLRQLSSSEKIIPVFQPPFSPHKHGKHKIFHHVRHLFPAYGLAQADWPILHLHSTISVAVSKYQVLFVFIHRFVLAGISPLFFLFFN